MNKQCIHPKEKLQTNFINVRQILQMSHKLYKCQTNYKCQTILQMSDNKTLTPKKKNSIPRSARLRLLALKNQTGEVTIWAPHVCL